MNRNIRTSETDPLRIATIGVGAQGGAIGITFAPGKKQLDAMTGVWARDVSTDLCAIVQWGADVLVTLLEPQEFSELGIPDLAPLARSCGLEWYGLPITDGEAPDNRLLIPWMVLGPQFCLRLQAGGRIVVHCKGGLGRAGTVACLLLMEADFVVNADEAISIVRAVRPGAIETSVQEEFLRGWRGGGA